MSNRFKFRVYDPTLKKLILFSLDNIIVSNNLLCQDKYPVQQYTGLNDKNGKEIFEGDIVKFKDLYASTNGQELIGAIIFNKAAFWAQVKSNYFYFDTEPEVIGNIYENPELLKKHENQKQKSQEQILS